ncbi:MAG: carbohydrate ABC transporter permease [Oscillospiraceae bacterium]|jgi:raffinose/stachyose/melibiose transport system permease protein|nr:carbohydrate ABC transporter permease [Oscillospiraceae bacterium]
MAQATMRRRRRGIGLEVLGGLLLLVWMIPLAIVFINASKTYGEVTANPLALPAHAGAFLDNLRAVFTDRTTDFAGAFWDSFLVTALSLATIVLFASMQAWVLVRRKTRLSAAAFFLYVAAMVIPFQVVMYPMIYFFRSLGEFLGLRLLDTHHGIVFAYLGFGCSMSVFIFHGFIKNIPLALEESATIDGCSQGRLFFSVVFPLLRPVCLTVMILQGIWIWNDYLLPVMMLGTNGRVQTVPIAVKMFAGTYIKQWNLILVTTVLAMLPVIVFFLFAQKYIIRGVIEGALK